jgi:colicin import membrane protein
MKPPWKYWLLGVMGWHLLSSVSSAAELATAPQTTDLATQRAAVEAEFAQAQQACQRQFVVTACVDAARQQRLARLAPLKEQALQQKEAQRHKLRDQRLQAVHRAVEAQAARASEVEGASEAGGDAPAPRSHHQPAHPDFKRPRKTVAPRLAGAEQRLSEQRSEAKFAAQQAAAKAHQAAVARRNAQRASEGKVTHPLPLPAN